MVEQIATNATKNEGSVLSFRVVKTGVLIFWSIIIGIASVRVAFSLIQKKPDVGLCLGHFVYGDGIVSTDTERKETGQIVVISVKTIFVDTKNLVVLSPQKVVDQYSCRSDLLVRMKTKLYPRFKYGDQINFFGKLSSPFNFSNNNGSTFDMQGYLAKDDIFYEIKSARITGVATTSENTRVFDNPNWLDGAQGFVIGKLFSLKRRFVGNLERVLGEPYTALASGLVVGEKSALGPKLLEDFRTVGLIHIVVLSGFNITIVAYALRKVLSGLPRIWGIVIGGIGMFLFCILVGGGATVIRSCFMASIALIADVTRRGYNVFRALIFVALIMLIQNPMILFHDPSFQLSFLATLGLILLASPIEKRLKYIPDRFGMRGTVAATLSTQIFVSPFILYLMGQLSLIGVVVNILVLPFIPMTMLVVFLSGVFGFVSQIISQVIGWGAHILLAYELLIVQNFARIPFASLRTPSFSVWFVVAFYVVFLAVYVYVNRRKET